MRLTRENFKLISGGQTGVDRAALDVAISLGVPHGGWCPKGRLSEDGPIPDEYKLQETDSPSYLVRTIRNVGDAHATLVLSWGPMTGGTWSTVEACENVQKPWKRVDVSPVEWSPRSEDLHDTVNWLESVRHLKVSEGHPLILNVAGPRGSKHPLVYASARRFIDELLERLGFYQERGK